jgi:hydrogenase-4 membrane subunit HyfE
MNLKRRANSFFAFLVFVFAFSVKRASAYIDPGTGSYLLQIAIAFLLGALFTIKGFWKKILALSKTVFTKKKK